MCVLRAGHSGLLDGAFGQALQENYLTYKNWPTRVCAALKEPA